MIVSLIGAMALAANAQTIQSARASRWRLQADPGLCVLERHDTEPAVTLSVRTLPGSDDYRVAIATPALEKLVSFAPATLTFAPSQKTRNGRANVVKLPDGARVIWMEGIPPGSLDDLSIADTVTIATKSGESASVKLTSSAKAVEALRRCNADQLIDWGADPGQFAPGGTMPVATKDRDVWLSKSQLLGVMGKSGRSDVDAAFRVAVSPDGAIDDCRALSDKTGKGVEKAVCDAVLKKPFFTAARDPGGQPVRGVATFRVLLASRPW
jgi:hypothetical protein